MIIPKIDIHAHTARYLYDEAVPPKAGDGKPYVSPEQLMAMYDAVGVKKGVILPLASPECSIMIFNEGVYAAVRQYPERFDWFCSVDPRGILNHPNADLSYYLEYYKSLGAKGVGEVVANLPFGDVRVRNLFFHCQKTKMPVLFHIAPQEGGCYGLVDALGLPGLEAALKEFPDLVLIGHSQPFWAQMSGDVTEAVRGGYPRGKVTAGRIAELLTRYPNLFCDMSAGSGMNAFMRDPEYAYGFIERFADRLMYGIDICSPNDGHHIVFSDWLGKSFADGCISQTNYEKICYKNAVKILGISL